MASVNKVILIGNLTKDPETRFMPNGDPTCSFSIACNESWKDKNGTKKEKVEYINIVIYRKLAEIAQQYLKKGRPVYIEGSLQTRKWEKDGVTRYSTQVIANTMQMLGTKDSGTNGTNNTQAPQADTSAAAHMITADDMATNEFEDDIPFYP